MKKTTAAAVLISLEFVVAGTVLLRTIQDNSARLSGGLVLLLLFCTVVATTGWFFVGLKKCIDECKSALAREHESQKSLQIQFDQAIEQRTFELQRVNGSLHREIAERIQAEEEVRELQKQLTLILDSAGEGILGLDNKGKVMFINSAASLMLGWEVEDMIGHAHHELIHHTHADGTVHPVEDCPIYMAYRDGKVHFKSDDVFWCKNGTSFPVEYVSTPIRDHGMLTGAVVVFRDLNTFK